MSTDVVAVDAQRRVDQLDLGADGDRMVGLKRSQHLVDGIDEPGQERWTISGSRPGPMRAVRHTKP